MQKLSTSDFFTFIEADKTTKQFILLSILTFGWYTSYWQYTLVRRTNMDLANPRISIFNYLTFIVLSTWTGYFFQGFPEAIGYALILFLFFIGIAVVVQIGKDVEEVFSSEHIRCKTSYSILFNVFYIYHITHKAWKLHNEEHCPPSQEHVE